MFHLSHSRLPRGRRAVAVPVVVIVVLILVIVFMGMSTFQRFQIKATGAASGNMIAFAAAEAGLAAAVAELQASADWATHEVDPSSLGSGKTTKDLAWSSKKIDHLNVLYKSKRKEDAGIACEIAKEENEGTYVGSVGEGNFQGEFKVRCGRIPYDDLEETRSRNEAERFYLIDSMGRSGDRVVRIRAIVEASNFTEFVIYDADFLELGMGMKNDDNENIFANGELYGGGCLKLGDIEDTGTKQVFKNMGKIQSGGPIIAEDSYTIEFSSPLNTAASLPSGFNSSSSAGYDTAKDNLVDGAHGGGFPAPNLPWDYYKSLSDAGIAARVSGGSSREGYDASLKHQNPHIGNLDVVTLDFGKNEGCEPMTAAGDDPISKPGSWDGLLYNDTGKPLVVFGCPDSDLTIVSEQDVYICGDFNQGLAKTPQSGADIRLNQHYENGKLAVNEDGNHKYMIFYDQDGSGPHRPCYLKTAGNLASARLPADRRERHAVAVISKGRIWFDFRYPTRVCGNEIRPFLAYELARAAYKDAEERGETIDGGSPAEAAYKKWGCRKSENSVDRDDLILAVKDSTGSFKLTTHVEEFFKDPWKTGDHGLLALSDYGDVESKIIAAANGASDPDEPKIDETKVDEILEELWKTLVKLDLSKRAGADGDCALYGDKSIFQAYYEKFWDSGSKSQNTPVDTYSDIHADKDDFFLPEMTINALLITSAKRNSAYWQPSAKSVSKAFDELGNANVSGSYRPYLVEPGKTVSSVIQRFVGAEIRLGKDLPDPRLGNAPYRPCIRKRIFDPTLHRFSPPHIPRTIVVRDWTRYGAVSKGFDDF